MKHLLQAIGTVVLVAIAIITMLILTYVSYILAIAAVLLLFITLVYHVLKLRAKTD